MGFNLVRLIAFIGISVILAGILFLQSASSFLMRKNAVMAVQLMPVNGLALEQVAAFEFTSGVKKSSDIVPSATKAAPTAMAATVLDPLTPKAYAVLALAERDTAKKQQILEAATRLNRRDLLLQGLVLESQVERKDYPGTLRTLDMIMRVHPEQKANFFPILTKALADDAALPALAGILDRNAEWQDEFLKYAVRQPEALVNLARLRLQRDAVDPEIDQRLIKGLLAAGDNSQAFSVYQKAAGETNLSKGENTQVSWHSGLPPFDWQLADEAGFRAQPALNSNALEIFIRGGKGGILAEKLLPNNGHGIAVRVSHSIKPAGQIGDMRWEASCPLTEKPYFQHRFRIRPDNFTIPPPSQNCDFVRIAIYGRSWTGRAPIKGTIDRLSLRRMGENTN